MSLEGLSRYLEEKKAKLLSHSTINPSEVVAVFNAFTEMYLNQSITITEKQVQIIGGVVKIINLTTTQKYILNPHIAELKEKLKDCVQYGKGVTSLRLL